MADGRQKDNPQHKQSCRRQNHQPRTQAKLLFFIGLLRLIFLLGLRLGLSLFLGQEFQPHQFRKPRQGLIIRFGSPVFPVGNRLPADEKRLRKLFLRHALFAARLPDFFAEVLRHGFVPCVRCTIEVNAHALPFASVPLSMIPIQSVVCSAAASS